jgi:hypothetical protein
MTEGDWNRGTDPWKMLSFLLTTARPSERKLRLFAVACCRRLANALPDSRTRSALDTAERFADGRADEEALREARAAAIRSFDAFRDSDEFGTFTGKESASAAVAGACWAGAARETDALDEVMDNAVGLGALMTGWRNGRQIELRRQCHSLRCIFGPLAFRLVTIPPSVRAWHGGTVRRLAEAAYAERQLPAGTLDPARLARRRPRGGRPDRRGASGPPPRPRSARQGVLGGGPGAPKGVTP